MDEYFTTKRDIIQVYFSPHAYHDGFDIQLNLEKFDDYEQPCAGMRFWFDNKQLILTNIFSRSPAAKIPPMEKQNAKCLAPEDWRDCGVYSPRSESSTPPSVTTIPPYLLINVLPSRD